MSQLQETYGQTEGRTDRPYFIAPFRLRPGVQKSLAESNVAYSKDFTFYKYHNPKEFAAKRSFDSKQNDLRFSSINLMY